MKKIILNLIFPILIINCFAQTNSSKFNYKLGDEIDLPKNSNEFAFLINDMQEAVDLFADKKGTIHVLKFNPKTLSKISEKEVERPEDDRKYEYLGTQILGNQVYFFKSLWDKESKTDVLFVNALDVNNGTFTKINRKLITSSKLAGRSLFDVRAFSSVITNKYEFVYSSSHSKLLISYKIKSEEKDAENDKIGLFVYNQNMEQLWGGEFTYPVSNDLMGDRNFYLDNKGNVYSIVKVYDDKKNREADKQTGQPAFHFEILKFSKDSQKPVISKIKSNDNFIIEPKLFETSIGNIYLGSTYSKKAESYDKRFSGYHYKNIDGTAFSYSIAGIYLSKLEESGKPADFGKSFYPLVKEELLKYASKKDLKKMEKQEENYEVPYLTLNDILQDKDGNLFIDMEEIFQISYNDASANGRNGRSETKEVNYYNNIVAFKLNSSGGMEWFKKIPKEQEAPLIKHNSEYSLGHKVFLNNSGVNFLFLDNKKNENLLETEEPFAYNTGKNGQLIVFNIDGKGKITRNIILNTEENNILIRPARFKPISVNQIIAPVNYEQPHRLLSINY